MITAVGPKGSDIREEIVMSVAQEEIETIVRVAAECDVPLAVDSSRADMSIGVLPPAIEEALAEVEAELAKAAGPRAPDGTEQRRRTVNQVSATPGVSAAVTPAAGITAASGEIEAGIGKLAGVLTTEIHEQWRRARSAFDQTVALRVKADQACREACAMLKQISRLEEQTRLACDRAAEARREAEVHREGAREARLRADASASAAELAADRAKKQPVATLE